MSEEESHDEYWVRVEKWKKAREARKHAHKNLQENAHWDLIQAAPNILVVYSSTFREDHISRLVSDLLEKYDFVVLLSSRGSKHGEIVIRPDSKFYPFLEERKSEDYVSSKDTPVMDSNRELQFECALDITRALPHVKLKYLWKTWRGKSRVSRLDMPPLHKIVEFAGTTGNGIVTYLAMFAGFFLNRRFGLIWWEAAAVVLTGYFLLWFFYVTVKDRLLWDYRL